MTTNNINDVAYGLVLPATLCIVELVPPSTGEVTLRRLFAFDPRRELVSSFGPDG